MEDGARETGGLDPVRERQRDERGRGGRRSPYAPENTRPDARPNGDDRGGATYAALDLGTNNCRLLIARPTGNSFRVIDAFSRIIRLGEGVSTSGRLSGPAVARAIDALSICRDKMRNRGVTRARLIATEACRAATNGGDFQSQVRDLVGLDLEIVDRETEAALAATGCTPLIDPQSPGVILFDIGGGSSELVRLGPSVHAGLGPPKPRIEAWVSLPVGVVTLAERHGGVDVTPDLFEAMVQEVAEHVAPFAQAHGHGLDGMHLLGTSGTVTTIAGVHLDLPRYDRRRVDGCWLSEGQISDVTGRLMEMDYRDRVANPCIGAERADLVLAGCAILEAIRRAFPCPRLRVADRGLREGILVELMRADDAWREAAQP
ncbi:MAG TPA: Ppx/GppA phosphatase family protein [Xanthobacteraceae bacterium]|nr:Ppx/GppA phosphatase family protein [Xanthobacteraceae bacterium]